MDPESRRQTTSIAVSKFLFVSMVCGFQLSLVLALQDIEIAVGRRNFEIDARNVQGTIYYQLNDLAEPFNLELSESDSRISVDGPRGRLLLNDGRPLVNYGEQYLLLAAPAWKRGRNDWWIPEDFLTKALPYIADRRLEKVEDRKFRVIGLGENRVQVQVINYPDHVSVVFLPERDVPANVRTVGAYIEVTFDRFLIRPELSEEVPDTGLVSALEFNPRDALGNFRIYKGRRYDSFRQYELSDPRRLVLDIYGPPQMARTDSEPAPSVPEMAPPPAPPPPAASAPVSTTDRTEPPIREVPREIVVIDPGHGGEDLGVHLSGDTLEKALTLSLARDIQNHLGDTGARLTRLRDVSLDLDQRAAIANYYQARLFLSIHVGGSPVSSLEGPVVYIHQPSRGDSEFSLPQAAGPAAITSLGDGGRLVPWDRAQLRFRDQSRRLAQQLQNALNELYGTQNSVIEAPLAGLETIQAPAVLVEVGFLTNESDRGRLASSGFRDQIASAIARVLLRFGP